MSKKSEIAPANSLVQSLHWLYDQIAGLKTHSSTDTAPCVIASSTRIQSDEYIESIIRWAVAEAALTGFTTNLGGIFFIPISLPANIAAIAAIQIHMIQQVACARGYNLRSEQVRTISIACLAGEAIVEILKSAGVGLGQKIAQQAISQISGAALIRINQQVGFRLVTKAGSQGIVNFSKFVPFVGGFIGGAIDGASTLAVAGVTKKTFPYIERNSDGPTIDGDVVLDPSSPGPVDAPPPASATS